MTRIITTKLLLSKWTRVNPVDKQKHYLVTEVIAPQVPGTDVEFVEIEAVINKRAHQMPWKELLDESVWIQGWVHNIQDGNVAPEIP